MTGEERIKMRSDLLQELYDTYFSKNGMGIKYANDDLRNDSEKGLAYEYLVEKRYAEKIFPGGRFTEFKITAYGIDEVESKSPKGDFFM